MVAEADHEAREIRAVKHQAARIPGESRQPRLDQRHGWDGRLGGDEALGDALMRQG